MYRSEPRPSVPTESNECRDWQDLSSAISAPSARTPAEETIPAPSVKLAFAFAVLRVFLRVTAPPRQRPGLFGSGFAGGTFRVGSGLLQFRHHSRQTPLHLEAIRTPTELARVLAQRLAERQM